MIECDEFQFGNGIKPPNVHERTLKVDSAEKMNRNLSIEISSKRAGLNMTLKEFSNMVGVSEKEIIKYESSTYDFTIEDIAKIFGALGVMVKFEFK